MMILKKRLLFIAPQFYNYHTQIITELKKSGYQVDWFKDESNDILSSVLRFVSPKLYSVFNVSRFSILTSLLQRHKYDVLLVIRGKGLKASWISRIKKNHPNIYSVMYQWDSDIKYPYSHLIDSFDLVYSFDYKDVNENRKLQYLPLFYSKDFLQISKENSLKQYDFLFLASFSMERYAFIQKLHNHFTNHNVTAYYRLYIPLSTYYRLKYVKRLPLNKNLITTRRIDKVQYLQLLTKTKAVIDYNHKDQTGLSMRILESYGASRIIYTNNLAVKQEPFLKKYPVFLFRDDCSNLILDDFDESIAPSEILDLTTWINKIVQNETTD